MMLSQLAPLAMAVLSGLLPSMFQNPNEPMLTLPVGWNSIVGAKTDSGAYVKGPSGNPIWFPPYRRTGYVARVMVEMDQLSFGLTSTISKSRIEVVLNTKGLLALSFPPVEKNDIGFDYWTTPKCRQELATSIGVILTRLDNVPGTLSVESQKKFGGPSDKYPFDFFAIISDFTFKPGETRLEHYDGKFGRKELAAVHLVTGEFPTKPSWLVDQNLMKGNLSIAEVKGGAVWCRFTKGERQATFIAPYGDYKSIILAVFACLTYQPPLR